MTGTITYILVRAGWRAMNGPLADERRRLAGAEPPAAYVSYDPRLLAGAGWYGYRIALKGGDRQMVERARYMLAERYIIRDGYEYYADGVYIFGVLLRERVPHYGVGGGAPTPEPDALNFYMPNGGTISLNKTGSPTVVELEYSLDECATWTVWPEDGSGNRSLTLTAGQRMYVRNTSETSTGFSTSLSNYYKFVFDDETEASGSVQSLLCRKPTNRIPANSFGYLFSQAIALTTPPEFSAEIFDDYSCRSMFYGCTNLLYSPEIKAKIIGNQSCISMFSGCTSMTEAKPIRAERVRAHALNKMFSGCISLQKAPYLAPTITGQSSFYEMFKGCTALKDASNVAIYAKDYTAYSMFHGCTALVKPPALKTEILGVCSYMNIFYGCTSLNKVETYMTNISATNALTSWLYGVAAQGDFYCPASLTIPTGASGIPSGWTRHDI